MEPLKNRYDDAFFAQLTNRLSEAFPKFSTPDFLATAQDHTWPDLELKDRMRKIAQSMETHLPMPYSEQIEVLKKSIWEGDALTLMCFPDFVELFGKKDWEVSMQALAYFTPFASAEFAIRPFLIEYPKQTLDQMVAWSKHDNHHVRRLASEGCRPRLPWAIALNAYKKDPSPILPILEKLKTDDSEYVRRSVANNLNDICKDHPALALELGESWQGISKETDWVVKHGLRTLLKKGNPKALQLFGFSAPDTIEIKQLQIQTPKIKIGDDLLFQFEVENTAKQPALLRLEYIIDYVKKTGKTSPKIFMISENTYAPGTHQIQRKQSFLDRTTRKHYPGIHQLSIVVNGIVKQKQTFELSS